MKKLLCLFLVLLLINMNWSYASGVIYMPKSANSNKTLAPSNISGSYNTNNSITEPGPMSNTSNNLTSADRIEDANNNYNNNLSSSLAPTTNNSNNVINNNTNIPDIQGPQIIENEPNTNITQNTNNAPIITNTTNANTIQNTLPLTDEAFKQIYIGDLNYTAYPFLQTDMLDEASLKTPSVDGMHIVGKNGWEYDVTAIGQYLLFKQTFIPLTWMEDCINKMLKLQNVCNALGKKVYFVITPRKEQVYPEYLPDGCYVTYNTVDDLELFTSYAQKVKGIDILYSLDVLTKSKKYVRTYFSKDTHWNQIGAYIATEELYRMMGLMNKPLNSCLLANDPLSAMGKYAYTVYYTGLGQLVSRNYTGDYSTSKIANSLSTSPYTHEITIIGDSFRFWMADKFELDFQKCNVIHRDALTGEKVKKALQNSNEIVIQIVSDAYVELPNIVEQVTKQLS